MVALGFSNRPPFQNGSNKSKITFDDIALKVQSGIISKTKRAALGQLFIYAAKIYLKSHGTTIIQHKEKDGSKKRTALHRAVLRKSLMYQDILTSRNTS